MKSRNMIQYDLNNVKQYTHFLYISNLVAKVPGLILGKKLSNLLKNRESLH